MELTNAGFNLCYVIPLERWRNDSHTPSLPPPPIFFGRHIFNKRIRALIVRIKKKISKEKSDMHVLTVEIL